MARHNTPRRPSPAAASRSKQPATAPRATRLPRAARIALAAVALVLVLTADDRWVGGVADGRQMIRTAIAITESGGIGQARGTDFTLPRDGGDAVSRYGMGFSLLQVPAAWLAPKVEAVRGAGSSQFLFLIVPLLGVLVTAWAAARAVLLLGAPPSAAVLAVLLGSLASPLASYAAMEFSEPVQAAALGIAFAAALAAVDGDDRQGRRLATAAGAAAGFAVLTKSSLVVVAPWTLLPLLATADARRLRSRIAACAAGAAPPLVLWLAFELARFGRPFGGYPDDRFTNNFFDGAWRLLVGPNRGMLLFFPAMALAALWTWLALRSGGRLPRLTAAAAWLPFAAMLAVAAPYWGWHGMEGWGPRLLVPAVALLAPPAAAQLARWPAAAGRTFIVACIVLNMAPLVQHPTPVATYIMNCAWPGVPEGRAIDDVPFYARSEAADGTATVVPFAVLEREPSASSFVVYPWFFLTATADPSRQISRLERPPWYRARPDIVPGPALLGSRLVRRLVPEPRLGFLGRSLWSGDGQTRAAGVYDAGLRDQIIRAQQLGDAGPAVTLAEKLVRLVPDGESDALMLESLRLAGRRLEAQSYLRSLPLARREHPKINVVLALFERDAGNPAGARALLETVTAAFPETPAASAASLPLSEWPSGLHAMTSVPRRDAQVAGPGPR